MAKILEKEPQLIIMKGKPVAVIIDIHDYEELLERLEDAEDLAELEKLRKGSLKFRSFDEFLKESENV